MRAFLALVLALALFAVLPLKASAATWSKGPFLSVFYFDGPNGKGSHSGLDAGNAMAIADGNIMAIEAGMVIEKVYVIVDAAVTGSTAIDVGDDDTADGFVKSASVTLGTPGMYGWDVKSAGAYL